MVRGKLRRLPRQREAPPERWELAFRRFAKGDMVRPDAAGNLYHALLRIAGHTEVDDELVKGCSKELEKMKMLSRVYVFDFFKAYEDKVLKGLEATFLSRAHFGAVQLRHVQDMIKEAGYIITPEDFQELLDEAARYLDIPEKKGGARTVDLSVVTFIMDALADREGFTNSQFERCKKSFEHFDVNGNGRLEDHELIPLTTWLGFCSTDARDLVRQAQELVRSTAQRELELIPEDGDYPPPDLSGALAGHLDFTDFLQMLRNHMNQDYTRTGQVFKKLDADKDGRLDVLELRHLFQQLQLELRPEALLESMVNHEILSERFSFHQFRQVLEYLRDAEGFSKAYFDDAISSFWHFDVKHQGLLSIRRTQKAIQWIGYGLGMSVFGSKSDWKERLVRGVVSETEFLRLCREHEDSELAIGRTVYRKYAAQQGAGLLRRDNLQTALKMVKVGYESLYPGWLKKQATLGKELDFEEYCKVLQDFRYMYRDIYRSNFCFTPREVKAYEESFKKYGLDSAGRLPQSKLADLFESIYPALKWDPTLKNALRQCIRKQDAQAKSVEFSAFLRALRAFEDAEADLLDQDAATVAKSFGLLPGEADDFMDAFHLCRCGGAAGVNAIPSATMRKILYCEAAHQAPMTFQQETGLYQIFQQLLGPPGPLRLEEFLQHVRHLREVPEADLAAGKYRKVEQHVAPPPPSSG